MNEKKDPKSSEQEQEQPKRAAAKPSILWRSRVSAGKLMLQMPEYS